MNTYSNVSNGAAPLQPNKQPSTFRKPSSMNQLMGVEAVQERIRLAIGRGIPAAERAALSYQQAGKLFLQTAQALARNEGRTFVVDEHNRDAIRHLVAYLIGDTTRASVDLRKGLCLYGQPGTGKTFLMAAYRLLCATIPVPGQQFRVHTTEQISHTVEAGRTSAALAPFLQGTLCLEDLGDELPVIKVYSNPIAVMETVLTERTRLFVETGLVTHATTHFKPDELAWRYGPQVYDRCRQLWNFVAVGDDTSPSRR